MWQRFTERARKVVFYAQEEAQKFGEGYVSTGVAREVYRVAVDVHGRVDEDATRVLRSNDGAARSGAAATVAWAGQ